MAFLELPTMQQIHGSGLLFCKKVPVGFKPLEACRSNIKVLRIAKHMFFDVPDIGILYALVESLTCLEIFSIEYDGHW